MTTIAERVAKGVAFLDEHDPDWWRADVNRAIDLDQLDLGSDKTCVLGQRCPLEVLRSYTLERWGTADSGEDESYVAYGHELSGLDGDRLVAWADDHGFALESAADRSPWDLLTDEWKRVILARREAGAS